MTGPIGASVCHGLFANPAQKDAPPSFNSLTSLVSLECGCRSFISLSNSFARSNFLLWMTSLLSFGISSSSSSVDINARKLKLFECR